MLPTPRLLRTLLISLAFVAVATCGRAQNLILNPSFEGPAFLPNSQNDGTPINSWTFASGEGSTIVNGFNALWLPASAGVQQYYMGLSGQDAVISQGGLSLVSGTGYVFTFDLSGLQGTANAQIIATFSDGSDSQSATFYATSDGWFNQSWVFTATDTASYTLSLHSSGGYRTNVDNLSLAAVPEPAAYAALAGVAALGFAARRRRHA